MRRGLPRPTSLLVLLLGGGALALTGACSGEDPPPSSTPPATGGADLGTGGTPDATGGAGPGTGGDATGGTGGGDTFPQWLSETGLYADGAMGETLAEGVERFVPRFPLWTDDAGKDRWIYLPPDTQIDTTDPDRWVFPPGTRLWKEFVRDGVRVETRLLERRPDDTWWMVAYQWNQDQTDAEARPLGVQNASGTPHDIPSEEDCRACHEQSPARVLGFSAIQLSHSGEGLTLTELTREALLTDAPTVPMIPGTQQEQELLGYLHANCGHCHQDSASASARTALRLWLPLGGLAQANGVADTPFYQTTVNKNVSQSDISPDGKTIHIVPGAPQDSALFLRVSSANRGTTYQMPPLGTEDADPSFVTLLESWINGL